MANDLLCEIESPYFILNILEYVENNLNFQYMVYQQKLL